MPGASPTTRAAAANARSSRTGRFLRDSRMAVTNTTSCGPSTSVRQASRRQKAASMPLGRMATPASGIQRATCAATTLLTAVSTMRSRHHPHNASLAPSSAALPYSME